LKDKPKKSKKSKAAQSIATKPLQTFDPSLETNSKPTSCPSKPIAIPIAITEVSTHSPANESESKEKERFQKAKEREDTKERLRLEKEKQKEDKDRLRLEKSKKAVLGVSNRLISLIVWSAMFAFSLLLLH
jgi:hypothetical protein